MDGEHAGMKHWLVQNLVVQPLWAAMPPIVVVQLLVTAQVPCHRQLAHASSFDA